MNPAATLFVNFLLLYTFPLTSRLINKAKIQDAIFCFTVFNSESSLDDRINADQQSVSDLGRGHSERHDKQNGVAFKYSDGGIIAHYDSHCHQQSHRNDWRENAGTLHTSQSVNQSINQSINKPVIQ